MDHRPNGTAGLARAIIVSKPFRESHNGFRNLARYHFEIYLRPTSYSIRCALKSILKQNRQHRSVDSEA